MRNILAPRLIQRLISTIALFASLLAIPLAHAASTEFRGAWVATVYNIDWPSKPGLSAAQQQAELRALLDRAQELKLNAILFQVRPQCDALYQSSREPWSPFLTGTMGASPGYDPLEFAIREAHARGIELHAWFNPFRALANASKPVSSNHVTKRNPSWVRKYGTSLWLDPGDPAAREYSLNVILDVLRRYDIDGIHIDDYFYPYPVRGASFPDQSTWDRFGKKSGLSRDDWRRQNINDFVQTLHRSIKSAKPRARFGISPFGIWRPGVPAGIEAGLDQYGQLYADARLWLEKGWCDYLAPQLYWPISPAKQSFPVLLDWWRSQSKSGRPVWPGIATDRIGSSRPAREMINQIAITRKGTPAGSAPGHIHWSMRALMNNKGGVNGLLKSDSYKEKATPPPR